MSTLTTILRRAGHITDADIDRVAAHARIHDCPHHASLLELELIDEATLVRLVASRLMVPVAAEEVLRRVEPTVLQYVPASLAWSGETLPISLDDAGNLTLAMADPTDATVVDLVAERTGLYLLRAVAPVTALRTALARCYGPMPKTNAPENPAQPPRRDTLRMTSREAPSPIPSEAAPGAQVLPQLRDAADRDAIIDALLDFLAQSFDRVILFIHLRNELKGRDARGPDLVREAVSQVRIPTKGPSVFSQVIGRGSVHFGPWPDSGVIDGRFARAMGGISGNVLVLPVKVRQKVPVLVFASGTSNLIDPRSLQHLVTEVETALERLIVKRKSAEMPSV